MHWQIHKDSNAHHAVAERRGERLPVAIAFGPDPAVTYSASAPLPGIDEYLFAGFLRGERVELVDCLTVPLQVPANAQVVLEGWLEPGAAAARGPVRRPHRLLHAGRAVPRADHRLHDDAASDPVFQTIVVGRPPQEDGPLGKATERIFLPLIQLTIPEIVDYDLPVEGVFHNCAIVSIDKRFPKHAQKVMNAIWGAGLLSLTKLHRRRRRRLRRARLPRGRVAGVRQRRLRATTSCSPRARSTTSTTRPTRSSGAASSASTRPRKLPTEGYTRGWPDDDRAGPRCRRAGRQALEGVRPVTTVQAATDAADGLVRVGRGARVPAPRHDRALGLRAAVRLRRRAFRDVRREQARPLGRAAAHHRRHGRRPHLRDGGQPDHRPRDRRAQPAHGQARAGHRRRRRPHARGPARSSPSPSSSPRQRFSTRCAWRWRRSR